MRYPAPLVQGSVIALTAFSAGVVEKYHPRLDRVIADFRQRGFTVVEGQCLRASHRHVSADKAQRAAELMAFLLDDAIDAVVPPWGGELAMELLPLLDYDKISAAKPKWVFGFSDVSTLCVALSTKCAWATAHCANFMQLNIAQSDGLTAGTLKILATPAGGQFSQSSSAMYQSKSIDFEHDDDATFHLSQPTTWKSLQQKVPSISMQGRLIGGCLDTIGHLFGSCYFDIERFSGCYPEQGTILYFENAELAPPALIRVLLSMRFKGVFDNLAGLLIGRSSAKSVDNSGLSYQEALVSVLCDCDFPIIYDLDIGHQPPNLTLINGAFASVALDSQSGTITQSFV